MSTHALASLYNYSDSEPEVEEEDQVLADEKPDKSSDEADSRVPTPEAASAEPPVPEPEPVKPKVTNLVSYNDDAPEDDDEETEGRVKDSPPGGASTEIPAEPTGRISPKMLEKVQRLHERMETGLDMNAVIQNKKEFRNPSIYEKLISFCDLNEQGTNYPPRIYDPMKWGKESFYEELAKAQNIEMEKREKDRKDKSKLEILSGTKKAGAGGTVEEELKKRKSKWDQVGSGLGMKVGSTLMQPTLTTAASGTKSTVISAFGSLPSKKPKL